jgi:hypothetical protein
VRALGALLKQSAPYDAGELAVLGAVGFERWTLTDDDEAVAAEDLLLQLTRRRQALRLDHPGELAAFPRTRERMARRGLQSLLALPLSAPGSPQGAVVLARRYGWAFVAAPVSSFQELVALAGLCLGCSRQLTALHRQLEAATGGGPTPDPERESLRRELAASREEACAARQIAEEEKAALRAELARAQRELESRQRGVTPQRAALGRRHRAQAERPSSELTASQPTARESVAPPGPSRT